MGGGPDVNPYGVAALGALGGWFSKTTTDKLQEVFETLFKTDADKERTDKLKPERPIIDAIDPDPVPAGRNDMAVKGRHFQDGATVQVAGRDVPTTFKSSTELAVSLAGVARAPASIVRVRNPTGTDSVSVDRAIDIL
jgi:hypothetical protein